MQPHPDTDYMLGVHEVYEWAEISHKLLVYDAAIEDFGIRDFCCVRVNISTNVVAPYCSAHATNIACLWYSSPNLFSCMVGILLDCSSALPICHYSISLYIIRPLRAKVLDGFCQSSLCPQVLPCISYRSILHQLERSTRSSGPQLQVCAPP